MKTKVDYTELDAAILAAMPTMLQELVEKLDHYAEKYPGQEFFRVLDRRLQALRKANKIFFTNKLWRLM